VTHEPEDTSSILGTSSVDPNKNEHDTSDKEIENILSFPTSDPKENESISDDSSSDENESIDTTKSMGTKDPLN
jgi:hypothetical protein